MKSEMPPIVVSPSTSVVFVRTPNSAGQVQLPSASGIAGRVITIKDIYGNLRTNSVTIQTAGTNVFEDGTASYTVTQAFGNFTFMSDGLNTWYKLAGSSNADMNIQSLVVSSIYGSGAGLYNLNAISSATLQSSLINLTSYGFVSTNQLISTTSGVYSYVNTFIQPNQMNSTIATSIVSTVAGLGSAGYISSYGTAVLQVGLNSTLQGLGSLGYISTMGAAEVTKANLVSSTKGLEDFVNADIVSTVTGLGSLGYISTVGAAEVTKAALVSTVVGLGTLGYLSSYGTAVLQAGLNSTVAGLGSLGYVSAATNVASTVAGLGSSGYLSSYSNAVFQGGLTSTVEGLGSLGYVSAATNVASTVAGLGSSGYLSSYSNAVFQGGLTSTVAGLGSLGYISTVGAAEVTKANLVSSTKGLEDFVNADVVSTVAGLASLGYVSSSQLTSTVQSLTTYISSFIDPTELASTIVGLGTNQYISTSAFNQANTSTSQGLGTLGYVSSSQLTSTVQSLNAYHILPNGRR